MSESVPLSALLSRALVAFTIELDNTWESRTPHRTTRFGGPRGAVYATSLVCWSNFMRAVPEQGVSIAELERTVRARLPLDGMRRWRYVTIAPDPGDQRARVPRREWRITPTRAGLGAQSVWRGLPEEIEQRWTRRFGASAVAGLREDLEALVRGLRLTDLPQWLTGHYGGYAGQELEFSRGTPAAAPDEWPLPFSALLSQVLQGLALEYETDSPAPLSYSANVLRLLGEDGIRVSGLPERSGVAIEPLRVALRILAKRRFIAVGPEPGRGTIQAGAAARARTRRAGPVSRPAGRARGRLAAARRRRHARAAAHDPRGDRHRARRRAGADVAGPRAPARELAQSRPRARRPPGLPDAPSERPSRRRLRLRHPTEPEIVRSPVCRLPDGKRTTIEELQ